MAWLRLDDGFAGHPKIAALTDGEFRVWLRLLCHCARYKRPTVDALTRREVTGLSAKKVTRFIALGLLDEAGDGSFVVHDWIRFQPKDPTAAERKARSRGT
jgi:hypothetical protein